MTASSTIPINLIHNRTSSTLIPCLSLCFLFSEFFFFNRKTRSCTKFLLMCPFALYFLTLIILFYVPSSAHKSQPNPQTINSRFYVYVYHNGHSPLPHPYAPHPTQVSSYNSSFRPQLACVLLATFYCYYYSLKSKILYAYIPFILELILILSTTILSSVTRTSMQAISKGKERKATKLLFTCIEMALVC